MIHFWKVISEEVRGFGSLGVDLVNCEFYLGFFEVDDFTVRKDRSNEKVGAIENRLICYQF